MATKEQIQQTADLLAVVTETMPSLRVPLADLPVWAQVLDVEQMFLSLRYDNRVRVTVNKGFSEIGMLVVDAYADVVRGLELPACPEGKPFGESVRLPVSELSRLESFGRSGVKAVA